MPTPHNKWFRVPPVTSAGGPQPFQNYYSQGMRQLPTTWYTAALNGATQSYFDVALGANEWARDKHILVTADLVFASAAPGPPIGLTLQDMFQWDGATTNAFNAAAASALPIPAPANISFRLAWDLYRNGADIWGANLGDAYVQIPRSSAAGNLLTNLKLNPAVGAIDFSITHTLTFAVKSNLAAANVVYSVQGVRAMIESPVNIGRTPL